MNEDLQKALKADLALLALEDHLIQRAGVLYRMGFTPDRITPTQMAAVAERIYTASNYEEARNTVIKFLTDQLNKLRAKAERSDQQTSWALRPLTGGGKETLGQTLSYWIEKEQFLQGKETPEDLDRLVALRRFWARFYGRYRYRAEMSQDMPLQCGQE